MMDKTIWVRGLEYALDLDRLFEVVFNTTEKENQNEIIETYHMVGSKPKLREKQSRELKLGSNSQRVQVRYDFIKSMVDEVCRIGLTSNPNTGFTEKESGVDASAMTFGEAMAFNTLVRYGVLVKVGK